MRQAIGHKRCGQPAIIGKKPFLGLQGYSRQGLVVAQRIQDAIPFLPATVSFQGDRQIAIQPERPCQNAAGWRDDFGIDVELLAIRFGIEGKQQFVAAARRGRIQMDHRTTGPDVGRAGQIGELFAPGNRLSQRQVVPAKSADIYVKIRKQRLVFAAIDQFRQAVEPCLLDHRIGNIQFVEYPGQRVPVDDHGFGGEKLALWITKRQPLHFRLAVNRSLDIGDADPEAIVGVKRFDLADDEAMAGIAIQPYRSAGQTQDQDRRQCQ